MGWVGLARYHNAHVYGRSELLTNEAEFLAYLLLRNIPPYGHHPDGGLGFTEKLFVVPIKSTAVVNPLRMLFCMWCHVHVREKGPILSVTPHFPSV